MIKQISRRAFLAWAALTGASLVGCTASEEAPEPEASTPMEASEPTFDPKLHEMSLEQKVAQLFVISPEELLGLAQAEDAAEDAAIQAQGLEQLTAINDSFGQAIAAVPVGGFIFFGGNLTGPDQTTSLLEDLHAEVLDACGVPPLLCVDEEGGTVARIANGRGFDVENVGDMADVGATGDPSLAQSAAFTLGSYLVPLGFNVDFAPVCDIVAEPEGNMMAKRSFGAEADDVAQMVSAQVHGFEEAGIACCLKHFPGIGAAQGDSHTGAIAIEADRDQLAQEELVPFKAGIEAGAPLVMVGHLSLPNVTGDDVPATLSGQVVNGILRGQLGFEGVVITDGMRMSAITDQYGSGEAAVAALEAGCDLILLPESLQGAYDAVTEAVASGRLTEERIEESVSRILQLKRAYLGSF